MNMLESKGAVSITEPTRKTSTFQTTLNHILTNDHQHQIVPGIFQCNISNHFPFFCKIDINHETNITKKGISKT